MADSDSRQGVRYTDPAVLQYVNRIHAGHDAALARAFAAAETDGLPGIQVGESEGRLLELLLRLVGARRVVELGTLAGYSAIRMARALPKEGVLWTVEADPLHAEVARRNLAAADLAATVTVVVGAGVDVLPTLERHGPFCAVFIDADKKSYAHYGAWAARHIRPGGLLLADNAYLFGQLLDDSETAAAMRRFHEEARARFDTVCAPTPDGLLVGIRR
jgi:caffeoyl-CoA O-methyltransferase